MDLLLWAAPLFGLAARFSHCPHRVVLGCSCRSPRVSVAELQLLGRLAHALVLAEG